MKWGVIFLTGLAILLTQGCSSEDEQYPGFSEMVAKRQKAREQISKGARQKENTGEGPLQKEPEHFFGAGENSPASSKIAYEKQIEILDSESRIPMAKGIAYLNSNGRIVKIKIIRK